MPATDVCQASRTGRTYKEKGYFWSEAVLNPMATGLTRRILGCERQWLGGAALIALGLGVLIYLTDRSATHALLIPAVGQLASMEFVGAAGQWLPSFLHVFAFSLLTASVMPIGGVGAFHACLTWWAIDCAFEFAQLPFVAALIAEEIDSALGVSQLSHSLAACLLHGTFDVADLLAATAGALTAAAVIAVVGSHGSKS
jgi:hypothetical protein